MSFLPPLLIQNKISRLFFDEPGKQATGAPTEKLGDQLVREFQAAVNELEDRLSEVLHLERMRGYRVTEAWGSPIRDDLLAYLHTTVTGERHPVNLPPVPMYLDAVIGAQEFWPGTVPRLGERLIQVVALDGFPQESYPGMLAALDQLPLRYRWSTRVIFLDAVEARGKLNAERKKWQQKIRGFMDQLLNQHAPKGAVNQDAVRMVEDAETALAEVNSSLVGYGHYTSVVVLSDTDPERLARQARQVKRVIDQLGFSARVEGVNTVEAFLGALPGHANPNLRRALPHTLNLADLLPLSAALAYARKIAAAIGGKIPKQTLADRNRLSQWIDQHKPDEPSEKQLAFARSLAERQQIVIEPDTLRSRRALSAWLSTHSS